MTPPFTLALATGGVAEGLRDRVERVEGEQRSIRLYGKWIPEADCVDVCTAGPLLSVLGPEVTAAAAADSGGPRSGSEVRCALRLSGRGKSGAAIK